MQPINLADYESAAKSVLPQLAYDYYAGGAHDEITLAENDRAFDRLRISYRVLRGVADRDLRTTLLGQPVSMPILVAATAFHQLAHPDGEAATARAAGGADTIMVLSTASNVAVEEVVAAASGPIWFQLYLSADRGLARDLVQRVEAAGCQAIVLTVDTPILGRRERDVRNGFALPPGLQAANLTGAGRGTVGPTTGDSGLAAYIGSLSDPALSWADIDWIRSVCDLPVLIKGVIRADDARTAVEVGVDGIVVSNHGGRQLDTAPATIDALPRIVDAVAGRTPILLDGGIRRGTDVLKAIALGATAVSVGRPILWGLAVNGEAGARHVLDILRQELDLAMALAGCRSISEITADLVEPAPRPW